ncbi:MAG: zinc ribbon domain-containing protein [Caldilineaceae bacterium]
MSDVQRICPQCQANAPLDARFCPRCGYDHQAELPMRQSSLPATVGKAAMPVLVGAATLALRVGWKLLNSRLTATEPQRMQPPAPAPRQEVALRGGGRRIRIRSSWAVGDANGVWRQGSSEHIIEFDD